MPSLPAAYVPSREAQLSWIRNQAQDVRIGRYIDDRGMQMTAIRLEHGGEYVEFEDVDPDGAVLQVTNWLRSLHRLAPLGEPPKRSDLEQQIVAARATGQASLAEQLEAELVAENVRTVRPVTVRSAFGRRTTWT